MAESERKTAIFDPPSSILHPLRLCVSAVARVWSVPAALAALTLLHGLLYLLLLPPWQTPDEPTLFEYAALTARLGRPPNMSEFDRELEARIVASMRRARFFHYTLGSEPASPPQTFDDVRTFFLMPRQVGGDPPLYFILAALPLRLLHNQPLELQLTALRLLNLLCTTGAVLCGYYAARELVAVGSRQSAVGSERQQHSALSTQHSALSTQHSALSTQHSALSTQHSALSTQHSALSTQHSALSTQHSALSTQYIPLAIALFMALQPMFIFTGLGAGNDALANLLGAALCLVLLRLLLRGFSLWQALLLLALALLGLLTKRSLIAPALLAAALLLWQSVRLYRRHSGALRTVPPEKEGGVLGERYPPRPSLFHAASAVKKALPTIVLALVGLWLAAQWDWNAAASWQRGGSQHPIARTRGAAPALVVAQGQVALQALSPVVVERVRNKGLWFTARVWGAAGTRGRLVVDVGGRLQELAFVLGPQPQALRLLAFVPLRAPPTQLQVIADQGTLYAGDLQATLAAAPEANLLLNGNTRWPALRIGTPLARLAHYGRLPELAWVLQSGRWREPPPHGWELPRFAFASFWGQFGWMHVRLVRGSPWEPLLALICLSAAGGLLWRTVRAASGLGLLLVLAALPALALLLMLGNAYTQPAEQALQQGRYLFPALLPCATLLAYGTAALLPASRQRLWFAIWLALWLALAGSALWTVGRFYS